MTKESIEKKKSSQLRKRLVKNLDEKQIKILQAYIESIS